MLPPFVREYTLNAVAGAPDVIEAWIVQIAGHDAYHMKQIVEWLRQGR